MIENQDGSGWLEGRILLNYNLKNRRSSHGLKNACKYSKQELVQSMDLNSSGITSNWLMAISVIFKFSIEPIVYGLP